MVTYGIPTILVTLSQFQVEIKTEDEGVVCHFILSFDYEENFKGDGIGVCLNAHPSGGGEGLIGPLSSSMFHCYHDMRTTISPLQVNYRKCHPTPVKKCCCYCRGSLTYYISTISII